MQQVYPLYKEFIQVGQITIAYQWEPDYQSSMAETEFQLYENTRLVSE